MPVSATPPPQALLGQLAQTPLLCIAEEHVAQGGFAAQLILYLALKGIHVPKLTTLFARSHTFDRYGSQRFLREKSWLDSASLLAAIAP
jgi:transketolase